MNSVLFLKDIVFISETYGKILYDIFDFMFILGKSLEIFVSLPNGGFYNNTYMPKYPPSPSPGWGGGLACGRFIEKKFGVKLGWIVSIEVQGRSLYQKKFSRSKMLASVKSMYSYGSN